ncbi:MAG: hypothetical protein DMF56_10550 [Acidobacteria bacterium]|nr:MAG: hypothetical protein DMF56_10550 [Acidobacteriota bacterium]
MKHDSLFLRLVRGAGAGIAGTFAIQNAMKVQGKLLPATKPPMRQDPADFMLEHAPIDIPEKAVPVAKKVMQLGYGITFGALYGALRKRPHNVMLEGALLGLGTWAAGYLGWLPKAGLLPSPKEQSAAQISGPIATHLVFGLATVGAYSRT